MAQQWSFFVLYNPKTLKPFCIQICWICFNFFKSSCLKLSFALKKGSLIPYWLMYQFRNKKMPNIFLLFLTKICDYSHCAPAELSINSTALIRWIWFWEIWNQVCCCAKEINNKKVILFGDNDPINTQLKPVLVQSGP